MTFEEDRAHGETGISGRRTDRITASVANVPYCKSGSFAWEFIPVAGKTFTDSGTRSCD